MKIGPKANAVLQAIQAGYNDGDSIAEYLNIPKTQVHSLVHPLKKDGLIVSGENHTYLAANIGQAVEVSNFGPRGNTRSPLAAENVLSRTEKLLTQLIDEIALLKPLLISPREREDYEQLKAMREMIDNMIDQSKPRAKRK